MQEVVKEVPFEVPVRREAPIEVRREAPARLTPRRRGDEPVRIAGGYKVWDRDENRPNLPLMHGYFPSQTYPPPGRSGSYYSSQSYPANGYSGQGYPRRAVGAGSAASLLRGDKRGRL